MKKPARKQIIPRRPRHALDYRRVLEIHEAVVSLLRLQVVNGDDPNPSVHFTQGNVTIVLPKITAGAGLSAFAITELGHQDYFVARMLSHVRLDDSTGLPIATVGSTDIKIAKVKDVRRSIISELKYSDTVTYTDDDATDIDNTRIGNNGVDDPEQQVCLPPYVTLATLGFTDTVPMTAQCVVYASKAPGLTGVFDGETQLEWLEDAGKSGVRAFAERNPET